MDLLNSKICVVGIGGVGGLIGGALAREYNNIYFFARGERKEALLKSGIHIKSKAIGEFVSYPKDVSDDSIKLGEMDVIFICVKNYSLEDVCENIKPMVGEKTILIPIMNGIEYGEVVRKTYPKNTVVSGVIYVIATALEDFSVAEEGSSCHLHIGKNSASDEEIKALEEISYLLNSVKISCDVEKDIYSRQWQKYLVNCAFNIITAYYDTDTKGIRERPERVNEYIQLLNEASFTARVLGVSLPEGIERNILDKFLNKQLDTATSSLKKDMHKRALNELDTFSKTLLEKASYAGLVLPTTKRFYEELKNRY